MSFLHFSVVFQTLQTAERVGVPCTSKTRPSGFTREIGTALRSFNENFHKYFTNISASFRSAKLRVATTNPRQVARLYDRTRGKGRPIRSPDNWMYGRLPGGVGSRLYLRDEQSRGSVASTIMPAGECPVLRDVALQAESAASHQCVRATDSSCCDPFRSVTAVVQVRYCCDTPTSMSSIVRAISSRARVFGSSVAEP